MRCVAWIIATGQSLFAWVGEAPVRRVLRLSVWPHTILATVRMCWARKRRTSVCRADPGIVAGVMAGTGFRFYESAGVPLCLTGRKRDELNTGLWRSW